MLTNRIFAVALGIKNPRFIENIDLDDEKRQLNVRISFRRGATFESNREGYDGMYKACDSQKKTWRHLNFFDYECYLHCKNTKNRFR